MAAGPALPALPLALQEPADHVFLAEMDQQDPPEFSDQVNEKAGLFGHRHQKKTTLDKSICRCLVAARMDPPNKRTLASCLTAFDPPARTCVRRIVRNDGPDNNQKQAVFQEASTPPLRTPGPVSWQ